MPRQAAKIRCRKCDYRIQIAQVPGTEEYEVTATPSSLSPAAPIRGERISMAAAGEGANVWSSPPNDGAPKEDSVATRKPTAAVPGLPGRRRSGRPRSRPGRAPKPPPRACPRGRSFSEGMAMADITLNVGNLDEAAPTVAAGQSFGYQENRGAGQVIATRKPAGSMRSRKAVKAAW